MANLAGLAGFVSELRAVRESLVNELRHVDAALSVLGKFGGGSKAYAVSLGSHAHEPRAESAVGKSKRSSAETQTHHVGISPQEDRGGTKGEVGENTGCEDEIGCLEANGLERSCSL